jgi:Spy/CpxP family protein refolding chaperone
MFIRILLIGLLAVTLATAQRGGGRGGGGRGGGDFGGGSFAPPSRLDMITDMLKLSKDQKKDLKTAMDDAQKAAAPVRDQILKSRLAIGDAVQGGKTEDEIKQLSAAFASLEAQMADIELKTFTKIYQSLDKEQAAHAPRLFPMMKGIFKGKNWNNPE